jgi:hypothetical protein
MRIRRIRVLGVSLLALALVLVSAGAGLAASEIPTTNRSITAGDGSLTIAVESAGNAGASHGNINPWTSPIDPSSSFEWFNQYVTITNFDLGGPAFSGATYARNIGAGYGQPVALPAPYTLVNDGVYSIVATGTGNVTGTITPAFGIDQQKPVVTDDMLPYYAGDATVTVTATDTISGVENMILTSFPLTRVVFEPLFSDPSNFSLALPFSGAGLHTFEYTVYDNAGNPTLGQKSFYIDDQAPSTTSNAAASYVGPATITLTAVDLPAPPAGSGVFHTYYKLDGASSATTYTVPIVVPAPSVGSASHALKFWSVDNVGNVETSTTANFTVAAPVSLSPVYRFRSLKTFGSYLWTIDPAEKASIIANLSKTWLYEGVAFNVNSANPINNAPLWRFRNLKLGSYLYTADPNEKANILANLSSTWALDGPAWNVSRTADSSALPVWRFRSLKNATYLWTADPNEKLTIETTLQSSYVLEGVAYYVGQ